MSMNETTEVSLDEVSDIDAELKALREALALVHKAIGMTSGHQVIAASEMGDVLLDIHGLIAPLVR
jgi:hypothetical protein